MLIRADIAAAVVPPGTSLPLGSIDAPVAGRRHTGPSIAVSGWAHAPGRTVARVEVLLGGERIRAGICRPRPDIAEAFGSAAALLSGFHAEVDLGAAAGRQILRADVRFLDGGRASLGPVEFRLDPAPEPPENVAPPPRPRPRGGGSGRVGRARVLIVARSLDHGGSQLRMAELVAHLASERRFDVTVLSPTDGPLARDLRRSGAVAEVGPDVRFGDPASYEARVADIAGWAADRFDLVCGYTMTNFPAVEIASRLGVPSVLRVGENEHIRTMSAWLANAMHPVVEARARRAFADADAVIFNSRAGIELHRRSGFDGSFVVLGTGVAVQSAAAFAGARTKAACRRELGVHPQRRVLVCAATMWPVKGQAQLVEALARVISGHPRLECVLVGQSQPEYAEALVAARDHHGLGDRLRVLPFREDLRPWWRAADVGVCCSETEAMPAAVLEAMSFGLPVLGTAVGGVPEVVQDGVTGWLCEPSDIGSMIDALERVGAADDARIRAMGDSARRLVLRDHDRDEALGRMTDLFLSLSGGRTPGWLAAQGSRIVTATSSVSSALPL